MKRRLRVALVSIGIGRFQRGFERFFTDLAEVMQDEIEITLYGGAPGAGRRVPPGLAALTPLAHRMPVGRVDTEYREYKQDCLAYGLALWPDLMRRRVDIVHLIDPPISKVMERLLPLVPGRPRLLYTNGTAWPVHICPRSARIHHVQEGSYRAALDAGDPPERNVLVPCGIHANRFKVEEDRTVLRARLGVAPDTFVVLVVTAVKRVHKRVDYVIDEVARLDGNVLLWIDGKPEDADLVTMAQERLGARCRISHVPSDKVGQLYNMADVMAHAALEESFGLTVVEALSTGLPVLAHDSPHFEWLVGSRELLVDMSRRDALRDRLTEAMRAHANALGSGREAQRAASVRARFDWSHLRPAYSALYQSTSE
jgi:glycosyltransferase involved in cell wall biosynthesis